MQLEQSVVEESITSGPPS